jgi:uncharacterized protein (DUF2147 family)
MLRYSITLLFIITLAGLKSQGSPMQEADRIVGIWVHEFGKSRIKIEKTGDRYHGKLVWMAEIKNDTGATATDLRNTNATLRDRPLLGSRIIQQFVYKGEDEWVNGSIYDPEKGKTFCGTLKLVSSDVLVIRGFPCQMSLMGRRETWRRFTGQP